MRKIPGYSRYAADENGNLYSLDYKRTGSMRMLKPAKDNSGYLRTMLLNDHGKYDTVKVHRIVALAYFGDPNGLHVNHKNGVKEDNRPTNLEYVTISENIKHAFATGLIVKKSGSKNGNSKLTEQQVIEIREYVKNHKGRYYGRKQLAEKYGISEAHVKDIVNERRGIWSGV